MALVVIEVDGDKEGVELAKKLSEYLKWYTIVAWSDEQEDKIDRDIFLGYTHGIKIGKPIWLREAD